MSTTEQELLEQARRVALPSLIGMEIGHTIWEGGWQPYPFILDAERELVSAAVSPEQEWYILNAPNQIGKLLTLETPIPTPSGWTTMGEVQVGDRVLGADGKPCNVTNVSHIQRERIHRLVFDDGSTVEAGPEHLWQTFDFDSFRSYSGSKRGGDLRIEHDPEWWDWRSAGGKGSEVLRTDEILATLTNKRGQSNHSIPNTFPLELPRADLPIEPWVLGYWLGNGGRGSGSVTTGSLAGDFDEKHVCGKLDDAGFGYSVRSDDARGQSRIHVRGLISQLKSLGIEHNKAVPPEYLRASKDQRLALLAGLMDSDGGPENAKKLSGSVSFSSKDEHLVEAVQELAHSLGCKTRRLDRQAKLNGKDCGPSHRVFFTPPFNPFTLPRKAALWQPSEETGRAMQRRTRQIVDIEVLEEVVEMRCISVDSPGNLYLAGEQMVPTHNTSYATLFIFWFIGMFPDRQVIFISYSEGYSSEIGRKVRDLFKMHGERLFGLEVDPDNDSQGDWSLKGHPSGGMLSVGWTGQIQGRQGHLVWIDDLLRTIIEAASATTKDAQWAEWQGTIWGRRQPGSLYVVSQTRLAEDDLSGRLIKQMETSEAGIGWKVLSYPGLCWVPESWEGPPEEYRDRLGRAAGEPLITRFSRPDDTPDKNWWLLAKRQLDNPQVFDCMVQQNPTNSEAGMFPEDRWVKLPRAEWPERFVATRVWDIAGTEGSGDFTVGAYLSKDFGGRYYIEGRYREQVGPEEGISQVKKHAEVDGHGVTILIEQGKSGSEKQLIEFYQQHLPGYTVEPAKTDGTKEQRALTYSVLQRQGNVVLPADEEDAEWVEKWIKEHKGMMGDGRRPRHDDQIDVGAYAVRWLAQHESSQWRDPNDDLDPERQMQLEAMLEAMGI